ncbi:glutamyl-tRNA reductase [Ignicoccus pacificus DSM 13166]|uniref:Glutamyl-tRNA reductase n=1 Tax=Ignicoccus pacificus DSM 13166 TaxID=940294 RepID=A0A977KB21_9CREN|nr:glutamyl-tRNA reductase [Ignicoccus pacificus DSM 13166]
MPASYRTPMFVDDLIMVGVDYKRAGKELVEKTNFPSLEAAYSAIMRVPAIREVVVLQTCNRFEVYAITTNKKATIESLKSIIEARAGVPIPDEKFNVRMNVDALRHLFRVASGLESMVLGEQDIMRQVRDALEYAVKNGYVSKPMRSLFEAAIKVGKRVRTVTQISKGTTGIPSASVTLAEELLEGLRGKKILVIGAGMAGQIIAKNSAKKGAYVIIANRTLSKAESLAKEVGGKAIPLEDIKKYLNEVDAVISAVGGGAKVLSYEDFNDVKKKLVVIDIAEPPSVDPKVAEHPLVVYKDIIAVAEVANKGIEERAKKVKHAEEIIEEEIDKFVRLTQRMLADKIMRELMEKMERVKDQEVNRAKRKVPEEYHPVLEKMASAIVKKTLKDVILKVKEAAERGDLQLLRAVVDVFSLKDSMGEIEIIYEYNGIAEKALSKSIPR